jgi:hypothetical protein
VLAAHPRRAHDRSVGAGLALTRELRPAVDGEWVRGVAFLIRAVERSVEHVVGADREQVGADGLARLTNPSHRVGVGGERPVRIALAVVDRGPRRAMDHDVGSDRGERGDDVGPHSDVELVVPSSDDVVARRRAHRHDVVTELPARPGDEDLHPETAFNGFSGTS